MKVEITKEKIVMTNNDYYMSIWNDGTIFTAILLNENMKVAGFSIQEQRVFDKMYLDFIKKDYKLVA